MSTQELWIWYQNMATFKVNSGLVCRGCAHVRQMRAILVNCIFSTLPQDPFAVIVHAPTWGLYWHFPHSRQLKSTSSWWREFLALGKVVPTDHEVLVQPKHWILTKLAERFGQARPVHWWWRIEMMCRGDIHRFSIESMLRAGFPFTYVYLQVVPVCW